MNQESAVADETTDPTPDAGLLEEIRAAEAAQQASVVTFPDGDVPDDLAKALDLRVEVNLAQHDGGPVRRVGGADATVRALEAPYSRRRAPEPAEPAKTRGSRRRRANKTAATAKNRKARS